MGKPCAVNGCRSGCDKDRRERTVSGLRQLTLFRTPKSTAVLEKWRKSLAQSLNAGDLVCELHFNDADISKTDEIKLPDGSVWSNPRLRYFLKKEAIPHIEKQQQQPQQQEIEKSIEIDCDESDEELMPKNVHEVVVTTEENPTETIDELLSIEEVKIHLADRLPEAWFWISMNPGITFIHVNRVSLERTIHLDLAPDLSLTVRLAQGRIIDVHRQVSSIDDLFMQFRNAEKLQVCSGVGLQKDRYAEQCTGIIEEEEAYIRQQRDPRCSVCRTLRKQMQTQERQKRVYVRKNPGSGHKLKNCKRKCCRLVNKNA